MGSACVGRTTTALRLLWLLVLGLTAVEFFFGFLMQASFRAYLYSPIYIAARPFVKIGNKYAIFSVGRSRMYTLNIIKNITYNESDMGTIGIKILNDTATMERVTGKNIFFEEITPEVTQKSIPFCKITQELNYSPVPVNWTTTMNDMKSKFPEVRKGGRYSPSKCIATHKVAIIVPFRNRHIHLAIFLNHMHTFLMEQQIDYGIFVIEQQGKNKFNRAKLFNVGFMEAQRLRRGGWQCFIFHDVDLLPVDSRNLYTCPRQPRHMSASIDYLKFKLPYANIFGGVSAMTLEQFTRVNGFSNQYWGWGGEDDDMFYRLKNKGYHIGRYGLSIARYASLPHTKSRPNPKRYKLLLKIKESRRHRRSESDGLSSLVHRIISVGKAHLYTHIWANIEARH